MESESESPHESTPPEAPAPAVPTHETIPVWARTIPVAPPVGDNGTQSALDTASEADPLPALPMQKETAPDWAKTETPAEPENEMDPKQAVPMQKPAPKWAQTVPAPPGAALDQFPSSQAPENARKRTWPPAARVQDALLPERANDAPQGAIQEDVAPAQGAIPEETDVWPPDPPTEHTMPAWPPSSTIKEGLPEPSTIPEAAAIDSWPDSFGSLPASATKPPVLASKPTREPAGEAKSTATLTPAAAPITPTVPPVEAVPQPATVPPAPMVPPAASDAPPASMPPAAPAAPSSAPAQESRADVDWPAAVSIPAWAPQIRVGTTQPPSQPSPEPVLAPKPAQPPATQPQPAQPQAAQPQAIAAQPAAVAAQRPAATPSKSSWEVVEQKKHDDPAKVVPTPEDRSYAEWFAWAKRGGAPASACHAAAQGAFQALSGGKDVATAVQWATAAMTRPPVPVSAGRQSYCAWFSLANIDLNLDQHKAHAFATASVHALDAGADAAAAHAAGLAAAGIR